MDPRRLPARMTEQKGWMPDDGDDEGEEDGDDGGEGGKQEEVIGYMTLASFYVSGDWDGLRVFSISDIFRSNSGRPVATTSQTRLRSTPKYS